MTIIYTYRLINLILKIKYFRKGSSSYSKELARPLKRNMPIGIKVVLVEKDTIKWILHERAFLVLVKSVLVRKLA